MHHIQGVPNILKHQNVHGLCHCDRSKRCAACLLLVTGRRHRCPLKSVAVIAAGYVQSRLGRPFSNPRSVAELKVTGKWTWRETVRSFATGFVEAGEAWEAVE